MACRCEGPRKEREKFWVVTLRNGNRSAFNGGRLTASDYSEIWCAGCRSPWRSKGGFVSRLLDWPWGRALPMNPEEVAEYRDHLRDGQGGSDGL